MIKNDRPGPRLLKGLLAVVPAVAFTVTVPSGVALAHDYCVHQGYDWGCVKHDHTQFSACDAETDGQRVYARGWHRTPQGYYDVGPAIWDPDGSGGSCAIGHRPRIDKLEVCETGPAGTRCEYGP